MNEYFGKRGMTVSVEVFITKVFETYHKHVYLVALDRCDQGVLETLCIADTVIEQFSKDHPQIKEIELKTDNAGTNSFVFLFSFSYSQNHNSRKLSCEWCWRSYV